MLEKLRENYYVHPDDMKFKDKNKARLKVGHASGICRALQVCHEGRQNL